MSAGTVTALVFVGAAALALGVGWARWCRAWDDYRDAVANMRAAWKSAWWHTWSLLRIGALFAVVVMIVVTVLRT